MELLDAKKDRELDTATVRGDSNKARALAMSEGDFRLRVTMHRADLYTMYIEP